MASLDVTRAGDDGRRHPLADAENTVGEASTPPNTKISYMNLPHKGQLALLCIARMVDPLAATSIQVPNTNTYV